MNDSLAVTMANRIELWPLDRLKPYAKNPRTHSDEQVTKIAASMTEFGFTNPILVDSNNGIVAGHGRLAAARLLKLEEVPVVVLDHLTEAQRRAYVIADNRLALEAGWDEELLAAEPAALEADDFDLSLTGFTADELTAIWAEADSTTGDDDSADDAPAAPEHAVSQPGDLWLLGRHRVLCGDATRTEDVEKLMAGKRGRMAFTDPPYNVDYEGAAGKIANDNLQGAFAAFLVAALANLLKVTDGAVYVCMSSSELDTLQAAFRQASGHWSTFVIWSKDRFTLGRSDYQRQYEPLLYGWREGARHYWCGDRDQGDVWSVNRPACNDLHPTMKPVELVERALLNSSKRGHIVVDLFGGSGSTLIACERTARTARLLELDPRFVDVIVQRWQVFTGKQATLAEAGPKQLTFAKVAMSRGCGQ